MGLFVLFELSPFFFGLPTYSLRLASNLDFILAVTSASSNGSIITTS